MEKKIEVGDRACLIDDSERGCGLDNCDYPQGAVTLEVSCKFQDNDYSACKCTHGMPCDFQDEITEENLREYPSLFTESTVE